MLIGHNNFVLAILFHHRFYEVKPAPALTSGYSSTLKMVADFLFPGEVLPLVLARVQIHLSFCSLYNFRA